jgi:serine/threonine protein kinase/Tol biopolymer transport system component
MGEVYRAQDAKLGREVALKVLRGGLAEDPHRMARFEREARLLAALNHPNIAAIYGLEDSGATHALVMELVEGPTLADRIARGPLPLDEALPLAKQICEALEYAHEHGIIHRDLKPANIKITPDGVVKILDFGLAKAVADDSVADDPSNSPTISAAATKAGMILGTAAYMSPEQAKGKAVDRRADIWAFGAVLYEMLTAKRLFSGEASSEVLAAVMLKEPTWDALPPETPPRLRHLLRRCLAKDPRQRLRDIGEARIGVEESLSPASSRESSEISVGEPTSRSKSGRALPWGIAAALAILAAALGLRIILRPQGPTAGAVVSFIPAPAGTSFRSYGFGAGPVVVSPDGKRLAFSATDREGVTKIWVRALDSASAAPVAGTDDAATLFWSPDSRSLEFFANGKLKTVDLSDGNLQTLADANPGRASAWAPGGVILFKRPRSNAIFKISATGGTPVPATHPSGDEEDSHPAILPDGKHFLFAAETGHGEHRIEVASLDGGEPKLILENCSFAGYAAGYLLFVRDYQVFAQPFDPGSLELSGKPSPLAKAVNFSVAGDSLLAFQAYSITSHLQWFDRSGNPERTTGKVAWYLSPKFSPDGKRVLATIVDTQSGTQDLWSFQASSGVSTRLTFAGEEGWKGWCVWSPDGKYIAFGGSSGGAAELYRKPADGSGQPEVLYSLGPGVAGLAAVDWSPDARYVSYDFYNPKEGREENWIVPLFGEKKPFQVAHAEASAFDGNFSPDGRWLAYFSYESGRPEVYVVPFPGPGGKYQISHNGGWLVRWAKGNKLFFSTMDNRLMEADLALSASSLEVKSIRPLFQMNPPSEAMPLFDVSADGERFVVLTSDRPDSNSITLIANWTALLRQK